MFVKGGNVLDSGCPLALTMLRYNTVKNWFEINYVPTCATRMKCHLEIQECKCMALSILMSGLLNRHFMLALLGALNWHATAVSLFAAFCIHGMHFIERMDALITQNKVVCYGATIVL
jgi:hypothetical protein